MTAVRTNVRLALMGGTADQDWMRGYEAARALCLTKGPEAAHLHRPKHPNQAHESGWDWGVWDYEDANGLPHSAKVERGA